MIKILIVDDHAILRAGLKHLLADCQDIAVAGEAGNGLDAIAKLRAEKWDAMVLDISMPGRSGIDLIKQIKSENPKLPILVLSMHKEDVYAVRALRAGAAGYLCKDNAESQLETAIRKVAGGGMYISQAVVEKLAEGMLHASRDDVLPHTRLSDREYEVFRKLAAGMGVTEIAHQLNVSVKTVSTHKLRMMRKMNFSSSTGLIHYAIKHGFTSETVGNAE